MSDPTGYDRLHEAAEEYETLEDAADLLETYLLLHDGKLGLHWIFAAAGRMAAGDPERDVLADFGYVKPIETDATGWRSVWRELLPETGVDVLMRLSDGRITVGRFGDDRCWDTDSDDDCLQLTHWQPLPEPPPQISRGVREENHLVNRTPLEGRGGS